MRLTSEIGLGTKIDLDSILKMLPEETTFLEIPQMIGIGLKEVLKCYGLDCEVFIIDEGEYAFTRLYNFDTWGDILKPSKYKAVVIYNDKKQRIYYETERGVIEYYQYKGTKLSGMLKKTPIKQLLNEYGKYRRND